MTILDFLEVMEELGKLANEFAKGIEAEYFNGPEKVQAMSDSIFKTMGPMEPFDLCAWVYVLDNISTCLKHQTEYDQDVVNLLREEYGCHDSRESRKGSADIRIALCYKEKGSAKADQSMQSQNNISNT